MKNKILIVDDEPNNLDVLRNCLQDANFEVLVAEDGATALEQVNYTIPDLILLDVIMPGMDGFETCRRLKKKEVTKDTPIIFISAKTETFNKVEGLNMSAVDYITKPFQPEEVIARVNKHLTIHNLRKQLEVQNTQLQNYVYHLESLATLGKAINETQDVVQMMDKAMQVTLAVFKCDRAWLLYPCDPNAASWRVPIEVTTPECPGAKKLNIDIPMEPTISEIMKNVLSTSEPIVFGPDCEYKVPQNTIEQFSVNSQLCLAIYPKIGKPWLFGIHQCSHTRIWIDDEVKLFQEFGQQIGVSLGLSISVEELHKNQERLSRKSYHDFIGTSIPMQIIYQTIDSVAASNASILITGATGTGKELCAEAIYKESDRADKPFKICNCATIAKDLLESHLFGHVKGAFTGAISDKAGLVSDADGGTLFLDEIGELSLSMQSSLLRFVQTKTFSKVGSHKPEKADVRLIYATNRNLLIESKKGRFREDLYYRLNTVEIELPVLRKRGQDIILLAKFFLEQFVNEEQSKLHGFYAEAEKKLLSYNWQGNVRQLKNIIHNIVLLSNDEEFITAEMIAARTDKFVQHDDVLVEENQKTPAVTIDEFCSFKDIEKQVITKCIDHCDGDIVKAANILKVSHGTLYNKLKRWKAKV
ncbi:sigma 54-interacting transcriptional regulator [Candidatus Halobeggiatoa sp. HSG11]|nr:sigma 54-interacting transcriptional regulator [Candidatus Halobeggiatoa sp. HSG11]